MFLLPYKLENEFVRVPTITTLVSLVCIITYLTQLYSWHVYQDDLRNFCHYEASETIKNSLTEAECIELFVRLDLSTNAVSELDNHIKQQSDFSIKPTLVLQQLERMRTIVTPPLTVRLWHKPGNYDLQTMLTSKLGHVGWQQMLFNLCFFVAFALSAEQLLGHIGFLCYLIFATITSGSLYNLAAAHLKIDTPCIGMTSIVSAVMMLVTINYSHRFLRMFFWALFVSGTFRIPLVLISISYLGSDFYTITITHGSDSLAYIHQAIGILIGGISGLTILLFRKARAYHTKQLGHSSR